MKKILIIILLLCFSTAYSQWSSSYSGSGTGDHSIQNAKGIANTVDAEGNVYATGYIENSQTGYDILLIKYKDNGDISWERTYNGTANSTDKAYGIITDAAGNIYITGMSTKSGLGSELILLKYNEEGTLLWVQTYGETKANLDDMGLDIGIDNSGNIYVTGFTTGKDSKRNITLLRYSSAGNLIFSAIDDGVEHLDSEGYGIAVDNFGNIFITGYTNSQNSLSNIITLKYDNTGNLQWRMTYNGAGNKNDKAFGIAEDNSRNVYVTGYVTRTSDTNNTDAILIKYDKKGSQVWIDTCNGNGNVSSDKAWGVVVDSDNMIYITGQTNVTSQGLDYLIVKYTPTGGRSWLKKYNGPANGDDYSTAISLSPNQKIVVTGASKGTNNTFDFATITLNCSNGNIPGNAIRYSMSNNTDDIAEDIAVTSNNKVFVTGYSMLNRTESSLSTIMINEDDKDNNVKTETALQFKLNQNYPNPFNPSTTIGFDIPLSANVKLVIYDMLGKVIDILINRQMDAGSYNISFKNSNLSSGIYFYELSTGDFREIKKMTLVK